MTLTPLAIALRPQPNRLRRAYRMQKVGESFHLITIVHGSSGYRLIRTIENASGDNTEEQVYKFPTLADLFVTARREGFYEDVAPNALGWQGFTLPKPETRSDVNIQILEYIDELEGLEGLFSGVEVQRPATRSDDYDRGYEGFEEFGGYDSEEAQRQAEHDMLVEYAWSNLGKNESIVQIDTEYDDYQSFEFYSDEPDDDMLETRRYDSQYD